MGQLEIKGKCETLQILVSDFCFFAFVHEWRQDLIFWLDWQTTENRCIKLKYIFFVAEKKNKCMYEEERFNKEGIITCRLNPILHWTHWGCPASSHWPVFLALMSAGDSGLLPPTVLRPSSSASTANCASAAWRALFCSSSCKSTKNTRHDVNGWLTWWNDHVKQKWCKLVVKEWNSTLFVTALAFVHTSILHIYSLYLTVYHSLVSRLCKQSW